MENECSCPIASEYPYNPIIKCAVHGAKRYRRRAARQEAAHAMDLGYRLSPATYARITGARVWNSTAFLVVLCILVCIIIAAGLMYMAANGVQG